MLIVPGTEASVSWGDTLDILPIIKDTPNPRQLHDFKKFIKEYIPELSSVEPTWVMTAMYG